MSVTSRRPRTPAALIPPALLGAALAALTGAASARAYDVVTRAQGTLDARAVAFVGNRCLVQAEDKNLTLSADDVDFYATFMRNLKRDSGNVLVFVTGSLLRFDRLEVDRGVATITISDKGRFSVPESLIDYKASVREGATTRLSAGATRSPVVAKSSQGGGAVTSSEGASETDDDAIASADTPAPAGGDVAKGRRALMSALAERRRRAAEAAAGGGGSTDSGGGPASSPTDASAGDVGSELTDTPSPPDDSGSDTGGTGEQPQGTNPGTSRNRSPFGRRDGRGSGGDDATSSGQSTVILSTDFAGEVGGIQVVLRYPVSAQLSGPVSFSGFAAGLTGMPNTQQPGLLQIAGVAPVGSAVSGPGAFLTLTFAWTGRQPGTQDFRIVQALASTPQSAAIPSFRVDVAVQ